MEDHRRISPVLFKSPCTNKSLKMSYINKACLFVISYIRVIYVHKISEGVTVFQIDAI